jgi:hypothetical protein
MIITVGHDVEHHLICECNQPSWRSVENLDDMWMCGNCGMVFTTRRIASSDDIYLIASYNCGCGDTWTYFYPRQRGIYQHGPQ